MTDLLANLPTGLPEELFETLTRGGEFQLKRIVSDGHCSPPDFWYDQDQHEWVVLLQGSAQLQLEGEPKLRSLTAGQSMLIPAHCKHRVAATSQTEQTVWLALYYRD